MPLHQESPAEPTAWSSPPPADEAHRTPPSESLLPASQPLAGPGEEPGTQHGHGPAEAPQPAPGARALLLSLTLFLLGFVLVAALLHLLIRRPLLLRADLRTAKLQIATEQGGHAFSAAFGSSHVHYGFDPRSFDAALAATPLRTRSLNLGIAGGSQTEQRVMALDFLARLQPPPRPEACFVLLELTAGANFTNDHLIHPRAINIYNAGTVRFVGQLTSPQLPLYQRVGRLGFAAVAASLHYANLGMLSNAIFPNPAPDTSYDHETADDRRGVLTAEATPAAREMLQTRLRQAPPHPVLSPGLVLPGNLALVHQLRSASPVAGLQVVYIVLPKLADLSASETYPEALEVDGQLVPLLNLAQPARFPELYTLDNWMDDSHLSAQGAALASTLLARSLQAFYAAHPTRTACGA